MHLLVGYQGGCRGPLSRRSSGDGCNVVICGTSKKDVQTLCKEGRLKEALHILDHMDQQGIQAHSDSYFCLLQGCIDTKSLAEGKHVHAHIIKSGFKPNVFLRNALVNMYAKCGSVVDARQVFDKMPKRDVVSWTTMIAGYVQQGNGEKALKLFWQMECESIKPDKIAFICVLKACAHLASLEQGSWIHAHIIKSRFESDVSVGNTLVVMYAKCGSIEHAQQVFSRMPKRDVVSWTAMISAYAHNGHGKDALKLFKQMQQNGVEPNKVTFIGVLDACAGMSALTEGMESHAGITNSGFESDIVVATALVSMYGKCGSLEDARSVFNKMHWRNVVSWTAITTAYCHNGLGKEALKLFQQMQWQGVKPDSTTFVSILSACSHSGLLDEGCYYFDAMSRNYGITPVAEHYGCMIDLFGRAGYLDEAEDLLNSMPFCPDAAKWGSLLGACRIYCDVHRGTRAADHILELDSKNTALYSLLSNIYAAASQWDDVANVRKVMADRAVRKDPGCSWIEVNDKVHAFVARDRSHPQTQEIYAELERLTEQIKKAGYVLDKNLALHDVEEDLKEHLLCYHSEKLAIAFGLLNTPCGTPLRIIKNLCVCVDCHTATKFISKISGRKIALRDVNRFHHFQD
eukprot:c28733_g3_i2 orf=144-2033(+)